MNFDIEIERSIEVIRTEMGKVGKTLSSETENHSRQLLKEWGIEFRVTILMEALESDKDEWMKIQKAERLGPFDEQ